MQARGRRASRQGPGIISKTLGFLGELLITAGVLVLLYVVYVIWGTSIQTDRAQDELRAETIERWQSSSESGEPSDQGSGEPGSDSGDDAAQPQEVELGDGYALLRIPRLGAEWEWVVVQGVGLDDLSRGPGHYADTAAPGALGNLSIAGHRAGHGAPFANLDRLEAGDSIEIETASGIWTYTVDVAPKIIQPTDTWVVNPVPGEGADVTPSERRLTLTTCHPRYGSSQRMYVSGVLTAGEEV